MPTFAELFANHTTFDWIGVIFSILYLYPIWLSLTNYQRTGSRDYLIFAGVFIGQAIHWNVYPFERMEVTQPQPNYIIIIVNMIAASGWMFLLFLHSLRLRWKEKPRVLLFLGLGLFTLIWISLINRFLGLGLFTPILSVPIFSGILLGPIFVELFRLYMRGLLIYAYATVKPDYSDQRVQAVRGIWLIMGIQEIFLGLGWLFYYFQGIWGSQSWIMIVYILSVTQTILFFLLGALFPEAMLISNVLVMRATKLYELVEQAQEFDPAQSRDYLLRYVQNLPPELLKELEPTPST